MGNLGGNTHKIRMVEKDSEQFSEVSLGLSVVQGLECSMMPLVLMVTHI